MQWYYSAESAALGLHSADDIEELFATGEISADTLVWRKGIAEWTPLGDTDEFAQLVDADLPPPLPAAQRQATTYGDQDDVLVADRRALQDPGFVNWSAEVNCRSINRASASFALCL